MKFQIVLFAMITALLGGCADLGSSRLSESAAHIELIGLSSPKLNVRPPELRLKATKLQLEGSVTKVFGADTTVHSHLTVSFYDGTRRLLQSTEVDFSPRKLETYRRSPFHNGYYKLVLDSLSPETALIEVRAHE